MEKSPIQSRHLFCRCLFAMAIMFAWSKVSLAHSPAFGGLPVRESFESAPDEDGRWQREELVEVPAGGASQEVFPLRVIHEMLELEGGRSEVLAVLVEKADCVMVELQPRVSPRALHVLLEPLGVSYSIQPERGLGENNYWVILANPRLESVPELVEYLQGFPQVIVYAESDVALVEDDDAPFNSQEGGEMAPRNGGEDPHMFSSPFFAQNEMEEVWKMSTGSGVIVAVIDTGVDLDHVDLSDNLWINEEEIPGNGKDDDGNGYVDDCHGGWDFGAILSINEDPYPEYGHEFAKDSRDREHGTKMAGVIAAVRNETMTRGIAYQSKIMFLRVTPSSALATKYGFVGDVARAICYAVDNGASVINCSFGVRHRKALRQAVEHARQKGVMIVGAAGNEGLKNDSTRDEYPGLYSKGHENVLAVGVVEDGKRVDYSNFSPVFVNLAIPEWEGHQLLVENEVVFQKQPGTSTATAVASGVAALIKSLRPNWSASQIRDHLEAHVIQYPSLEGVFKTGGVLDILGAVKGVHAGHLHFVGAKFQIWNEEESPEVEFTFERQGGHVGEVSVSAKIYHIHTTPSDFETVLLPTLTWQDGESGAKSFTIKIANDDHTDDGENFALQVEAVGFASKDPGYPLYGINKIVDGDYAKNQVGFLVPSFTMNEGDGAVYIPVVRTHDNKEIWIYYQIIPLTAGWGDLNGGAVMGSLKWGDGQKGVRSFPILVKDDLKMENAEALRIVLSQHTPESPSIIDPSRSEFLLFIEDNDGDDKGAKNFQWMP